MQISAAGRQKALSSDTSFPSENTDSEYRQLQTQYVGVFSVMPSLLQDSRVSYGVPYDIAQAMASRVINELRKRLDPISPEKRLEKIKKLVDVMKEEAVQVEIMLTRT